MSVYSGFATRQQQSKYNVLIENLVLALKKRVIKFYNKENCDEDKFKLLIKKIYKKMYLLEKGKFMQPKYSTCFGDLIGLLGIEINYDSMSDASSIVSQSFTVVGEGKEGERQENGAMSTNRGGDFLRSRTILQSKKNEIEVALRRDRGNSLETLSVEKSRKFDGAENREFQFQSQGRKVSFGEEARSKALARIRLNNSKELNQLRGTSHFPRMVDYMPKPFELPPQSLFESPRKPESKEQKELKEPKEHRSFRRQKFSRSDMEVQDM